VHWAQLGAKGLRSKRSEVLCGILLYHVYAPLCVRPPHPMLPTPETTWPVHDATRTAFEEGTLLAHVSVRGTLPLTCISMTWMAGRMSRRGAGTLLVWVGIATSVHPHHQFHKKHIPLPTGLLYWMQSLCIHAGHA
jgi:hypothetical protein